MVEPVQRSEAARAASRRNGARSFGPRTLKGKRKSSANALKHGLRARQSVEPKFLPAWVQIIELRIRSCIGYLGMKRREAMDRAITAMLLLDQVDRALAAEMADLHAQLHSPDLAERLRDGRFDLARLRKLLGYRCRFRGTRDKALYRFTVDGLMVDPRLMAPKKKRGKKAEKSAKAAAAAAPSPSPAPLSSSTSSTSGS